MRPLALALGIALLAACTVGPDHVRPTLDVPEGFIRTSEAAAQADGALAPVPDADLAFWTRFGDAQLTALVDEALHANHDLRIALARVDRARALLRETRFDAVPTVRAQADAQRALRDADSAAGGPRDVETYGAGVALGWELDVFGRVRRAVEAQRAGREASEADLAAVQVAIAGEVARTYVDLRGLQARLAIAADNAANQARTLQLVQVRADAGAASAFDVQRATALLAGTRARQPALQAAIARDQHRLAVLVGRTPDALVAALEPATAVPTLPDAVAPDTPGVLLRRRPDVQAAEARLHAATARIGVATADLFPRFTLSGLLGTQGATFDALGSDGSGTRLVALGVDWSFLDAGRVRARIAAARADAGADLARYEQVVLQALEDTEGALVRDARTRQEAAELDAAARAARDAARLAAVRQDAGASGLLEVLDAQRVQLAAEDAAVDARARAVIAAIEVHRALAGGWPARGVDRVEVARR